MTTQVTGYTPTYHTVTELKEEDFGNPVILIKDKVEAKIRFLCNKINHIEWSGVLFYTPEGKLEEGTLKIVCEDIFLMDIGSSGFTKFSEDADIIAYQMEHDLLDCKTGLIHSHNTMAAFFSGTDNNTLYQEGSNMPHFVSLIVNNAGSYVAKITRDVQIHSEITSHNTYVIKDFDDGSYTSEDNETTSDDSHEIQAVSLKIEFETPNESMQELDDRITEVRGKSTPSYGYGYGGYTGYSPHYGQSGGTGEDYKRNSGTGGTRQIPLEDDEQEWEDYFQSFQSGEEENKGEAKKKEVKPLVVRHGDTDTSAYEDVKIDTELIDSIVFQMITGSVITASSNSVDMRAWANNMPKLFDKRFVTFATFKDWAGGFLDHLIFNTDITIEGMSQDDAIVALAYHVKKRIQSLPSNRYLDEYARELERYIV